MDTSPTFSLVESRSWRDYELLDTGDSCKLERFGKYVFARPEVQAMWSRSLPPKEWTAADATFEPTNEENGGHWVFKRKEPERWQMTYPLIQGAHSSAGRGTAAFAPASSAPGRERERLMAPLNGAEGKARTAQSLRFWAMTTYGRHLGVFPEAAAHWDLIAELIYGAMNSSGGPAAEPVAVLNLFGYTGLATLAAAAAGARVTHVDASRKSVNWARENQSLSGLDDRPIRWIVDDALKFVEREGRRGARYDAIILDPPKFGRGPKGEIWEAYKSLPRLIQACRGILSDRPLFVILTAYAVKTSAIHIGQALDEVVKDHGGSLQVGELVTRETSGHRLLSQAVFARWLSS